ncbi:MAG: DUF6263 family protein [Nitrososphaerales archaeon]
MGRLSLGLMFVFSLTASAQEKVSFEWKFEKDKPFYQQMTTKTTQTMKVMGMDVNQTQEQTFYFKWTPVSQDKDGKWTLKQKIEGVKMKIDIAGNPITYDSTQPTPQGGANTALSDFFKAIVDAEFTLVLGKNNKVESVSGRKEFLDKLVGANAQMKPLLETLLTEEALKQMADPTFGMIPPEPKAVKDTWSVTTTLALGPIGMHGTAEANRIVLETDCLLSVGVRFSDRSTGRFDAFCPDAKIIHIDIDPSEIGKNKRVHLPIVGDAKVTLEQIYERLKSKIVEQRNDSPWLRRVEEVREEVRRNAKLDGSNRLMSVQIIKKIRQLLPPEGILATEVGKHQMFAEIHYKVVRPRTWITSTGLGTMGFGFPASIGAKVAKPDVPVVDLAGDGSFCMTENSLAVCVEEGIPVIVVIMDNRSLGMVEQWQRIFYNRRYSSVKFGSTPDFVRLAESYGAVGIRAHTLEEFEKAFNHALLSEVATVIDVPIDPEEDVYPFVPPGAGLKDILYGPNG